LESQASKLWGVFGFSEIGLGYFSVNVLLLLFLPKVVFVLAVLNLLTLPYVFWSIWYQKVKVKQWCPLCIIVQVLLWSNFIINFLVGYINLQELNLLIIIFVACLYVIFVFGFNIIIQIFSKRIEVERIKQNFNSLKANEEVFSILLKQQPKYDVSRNDSQIIVGNSEAPMLVTIFTNPFCKPCAKMHKQVKKLIEGAKDNICVQYIFSSSNNETDLVCKNLIAVYLKKGQKEFEVIFDDWFEKGKFIRDFFFSNLQLDLNNLEVEIELEQHKTCTEKTQIQATPTILINSYQLPIDYDIEDLLYLTEFSVNIK
jgi:hypothetical protein